MKLNLLAIAAASLLTSCALLPGNALDKYENAVASGSQNADYLQAKALKDGYTPDQVNGAFRAGRIRREGAKADLISRYRDESLLYAVEKRATFLKGLSKKVVEQGEYLSMTPEDILSLCEGTAFKNVAECNRDLPYYETPPASKILSDVIAGQLRREYGVEYTGELLNNLRWPE